MMSPPARVVLALSAAAAARGGSPDAATISLSTAPASAQIDGHFASCSIEINNALQYFGHVGAPNLPFAALCNVLRNESGGRGPSVRIGGGSADSSLWWEAAAPLPPNQTYAITHADVAAYAAALPLFDGYAVIDTSMFLQDDASWGAAHVSNVSALWGWARVEGVEIGNEVDAYHDSGIRPHAWSEADYADEFAAHVAALEAAGMPHGRVQGATYCCDNPSYVGSFANYTRRFAGSGAGVLASISWHHYALHGCAGAAPLTVFDLLADAASAGSAAFLQPLAATTRAAGLPFRVGEGNTVNCGGRANVSDVFASALFALDVQLAAAAAGVAQWAWHGGPGAHYAPVSFARAPAPPGPPDVRPLFYGMWAFARATRGGARVMAANVASTNPLVKLWALRSGAAAWTVVAVHKDANATGPATVTVVPPPGLSVAAEGGALERLLAPSVLARYGVSLAGQTFDGSADGRPVGARAAERVARTPAGALVFAVAPATAAVLTFEAS